MPGHLKFSLSAPQRAALLDVRDHSLKPYLRERAAALLKIADGLSGREVAHHRLNRSHGQNTIYEWVKRYQAQGITGLKIKSGRGRKPAFSPSLPRRGHRSRRLSAHPAPTAQRV